MSSQRYLITARKYRPQLFGELVAQEHVTETLKNAIRLDRLAHAYLFSGPRGVGKTTAARILAKAINCTTPPEQRTDAAEPCRACESCRSFEEGRSLNIIEIDAASNNKVEDVRDLRETVRIPPQGSRKKVYIVDEVHMLSNAAFNALLKTLEEPPPYVLFIFATTEPHKVIPTILSRCQRFDFRRIAVPEIVARLQEICVEEQIEADEASLVLIARKGDGALRDALSAFDQAVSLCGSHLEYPELAQALGVVDIDLFFEATNHVQARDSAGMLRLVDRLVRSGYDLQEFLYGFAEHLRNLLVAVSTGSTDLVEAGEAVRRRYADAAQGFEEADLLRLLMICGEAGQALKESTQPRLKLETGLLKMIALSGSADLRRALEGLERLEALAREGKLPGGAAEPPRPSPVRAAPPPPIERGPEPRVAEPDAPYRAAAQRAEAPETPAEDRPRTSTIHRLHPQVGEAAAVPPAASAEEEWVPADEEEGRPEPEPAVRPTPRPEPVAAPASLGLFSTPALTLAKPPRDARSGGGSSSGGLFAGSAALATAPIVEVVSSPSPAFEQVLAAWPEFVQRVRSEALRIGVVLAEGAPQAVEAGTLTVGVPSAFHRQMLDESRDTLLKHLARLVEPPVSRLQFVVTHTLHPEAATSGTASEKPEISPSEYLQRRSQDDPVVRAIMEHFGGEIVW